MTGSMHETAHDAGSGLRQKASDAAHAARDHAAQRAEDARNGVADDVGELASAFRSAADRLRDGSPQARGIGRIADGLADASQGLHDKDLGEMADELNDFARRNPVAFLGGAALLGFAATRFARASARDDTERRRVAEPDMGATPPSPVPAAPYNSGGTP